MIADLAARRPEYTVSPWVWAPALIIGVCIGAFPTYHHHTANTVYAALDQLPQYLPAILGALLIFLAVMTSAPLQRGLSSRPLLLLGKISFSMYLVHLIILGTFSAALFAFTARALPYHLAFLGMLLPTLAVIAGVSWAFYRVVDQPAIQWSQAFAQAITSRSAQLQPQPQERRETP